MQHFFTQVFDTSRYTSLVDKDRARIIYGTASIIIIATTIFALIYRIPVTDETIWQYASTDPGYVILAAVAYALSAGSLVLVRRGWLNLAALGVVLMWFLSFGMGTAVLGMYSSPAGMVVFIIVLLSGLLLRARGLVLGTALAVVILLVGIAIRATVPRPETVNNQSELISSVILLVMFAAMVYFYLRFSRLNREEGLAKVLEQRLRLAEITAQLTQRIAARTSLEDLLKNSVEQIVASYPEIYHAQIFIVDPDEQKAYLMASTGEVGQMLLARQHSLDIGSRSVIGRVTASGQQVVAHAGTKDSIHRRNELLPDTVVEAAFPLMSGSMVIGALDLQSRSADAFQPHDLPMFRTLSDHIAVAIDNARLAEQTTRQLDENKRLAEQSRGALREVERLNRHLTGQSWLEYLRYHPERVGVSIDFAQNLSQPFDDWTPGLEAAVRQNQITQHQHDDWQVIAVPLRVRGQVIGAMEFELDETGALAPQDMELIREVSERFGLAAENARLYEQSRSAAQQEALMNEIGARLQTSTSVEATLAEAAFSLQRTLRANKVAIRLGTAPLGSGSQKGGE